MMGNLAAVVVLTKGLSWAWRAACQLFHPGISSMLAKHLVKRSLADSLWWDPAAAGEENVFLVRLEQMAATQLPWETSLWTWLVGGGSLLPWGWAVARQGE